MRRDMHKVVVERERYNSSARSAKTRLRISNYDPERDDDLPSRVSNARLYAPRGRDKGFTDVLGPLQRFLEKQVGRPWTKVTASS